MGNMKTESCLDGGVRSMTGELAQAIVKKRSPQTLWLSSLSRTP